MSLRGRLSFSVVRALKDPRKIARFIKWGLDGTLLEKHRIEKWFRDSEICLLSFPRSGQTWLRVMMGKAIYDRYGLEGKEKLYYAHKQTLEAGIPQAYISHDDAYGSALSYENALANRRVYKGKKVVLLVRDIRDVMCSWYAYRRNRGNRFNGTMDDFLRSPLFGVTPNVVFHRAWYERQELPQDFMLVRYEDLHLDPQATLSRVLKFVGADVDNPTIEAAIEYSAFQNMRKMEAQGSYVADRLKKPADSSDAAYHTRQGKFGTYADTLSQAQIDYIEGELDRLNAPKEWLYFDNSS